ncbi:glycosyltransferase family 4 protein [bacterium]|nr:glycosyltransferase family 4 protein [bacterium]
MKIGIDIRTLMDRQYSGVSEYALNLILGILLKNEINQEHEIKLFYNSGRNIIKQMPDFKKYKCKIVYSRYPNKIFNYLMQKGLGFPKLDRLLGVDLFIFPHINFFNTSSRCKTILTIHDLSFLRYPEFFSLRKNIWHFMLNIKKMVKKVDVIIAISENTKKDIVELLGVDGDRVKVVESGINKEEFGVVNPQDYKYKEIRKKYDLPSNFFLYLGNLEPRKNIVRIIKAYDIFIKNYPKLNYELIIAGGGGWKNKDIYKVYNKSKNKNKIKFLGYISRDEKKYFYNMAALFLFPSLYEGFGLPPLEAMACGVPVLTSSISSLPEVTRNCAILVNPSDFRSIARGMEEGVLNKKLRENLILKGFENVKFFDKSKTVDGYFEVINSLIKN